MIGPRDRIRISRKKRFANRVLVFYPSTTLWGDLKSAPERRRDIEDLARTLGARGNLEFVDINPDAYRGHRLEALTTGGTYGEDGFPAVIIEVNNRGRSWIERDSALKELIDYVKIPHITFMF